jgi:hypothetical protein
MTYAQAITALSTALACADDENTVADALRAKRVDPETVRGSDVDRTLALVESHIRRHLGGQSEAARYTPDLVALLS